MASWASSSRRSCRSRRSVWWSTWLFGSPSGTSIAIAKARRSLEPLFDDLPTIELAFRGPIIPWRGPAPFHFVEVPESESREIEAVASLVTYGWGAIPATVRIGETTWTTSLFPRNGRYLVPIKDAVRKAEGLELGDVVDVDLSLQLRQPPPPDG